MALVITGALSLATESAALSLKYPRFGYENVLRQSNCTITTSSAQDNAEGESVINGLTWDFWKPATTPGVIAFSFTEAVTCDYCGIAGHTLTETSNSVELQYFDESTSPGEWVSLGSVLPGSESGNKTIMFLFDSVSARVWRLIVSGGSEPPAIGVVSLGAVLISQRMIYGGHTPITLSKDTVMRPQKSEGGQWLGRSLVREGASTSIALKNLTAAWVRSHFYPFMESARTYPFFFAWRPIAPYSEEVAYCWTSKDISVSNMGQADLMETSFSVDAIVE